MTHEKGRACRGLPLLLEVLVFASLVLCSGCTMLAVGAAGAASGTGVAYMMGAVKTTVTDPPDAVAKAAQQAFDGLEITEISAQVSKLDAKVIGRSATDKKIVVTVKREGEGISHVAIRVGLFGDESISHQILTEMTKHLK